MRNSDGVFSLMASYLISKIASTLCFLKSPVLSLTAQPEPIIEYGNDALALIRHRAPLEFSQIRAMPLES